MRWSLLFGLVWLVFGPILLAAEPQVVFEDRFDGKLDKNWSWLREEPQAHRLTDGGLEIQVQPGLADTVKNALLRPAPDRRQGTFAIDVTVTFTTAPTNQYEQGGLTWYQKGKPVFKLVHERIDGKTYIIPGKVAAPAATVQLRLVVSADKYTAQFRADGKGDFQTASSGSLPVPGEDQISIQCYNGPPEAKHWIRFSDFRILKLPD